MTGSDTQSRRAEETFLITLERMVQTLNNGDLRATIAMNKNREPASYGHSVDPDETQQRNQPLRTRPTDVPFVIQDHIGSGGLAIVDAATQNCLEREVAIKRVRRDRQTSSNLNNLVREGRLLAKLDHPNIAPVYELAYNENGDPILVMKRIHGKPWTHYLGTAPEFSGTKDVHRFHLSVLLQVCSAVEYAHRQGILHLDLKTDNVMVGEFGEVYLLDWGVAVEMDQHKRHMMDTFSGTPRFAAPEMFNPRKPLTTHTDIYLLGGVLHEILVQRPLHDGRLLQDIILQARLSEPYPYDDTIPEALVNIAHRATARDPDDRFEDVRSLRDAIQHYLDNPHAMMLLQSAKTRLTVLRNAVDDSTEQTFDIYRLAFETRYAYLQVLKTAPELTEAHEGLLKTVRLLFIYVVRRGLIDEARPLLKEILTLNPPPDIEEEMRGMLQDEELKAIRATELNTQIQYKLLEELQAKALKDADD